MVDRVSNFIGGRWETSSTSHTRDVVNPATGELLATVPMSRASEVDRAVSVALQAFASWRQVPAVNRARYLFRYKTLVETHAEELARTITLEHGKTLDESRGSVRRGLENVEHACAMPALLLGDVLEDVTAGVDTETTRQPIGVFAAATPSSYPAMVPLWFWPYAVAAGNTFVVKPSQQVPLSQQFLFELIEQAGFPAGVVNLVHGDREVVDALIEHPGLAGLSFVGSSPVAREVYRRAAEHGKRIQALGGAKNHLVVMPDARMERTVASLIESCFGCAGQRSFAGSVVIAVGDAHKRLRAQLVEAAREIVVGNGLDFDVTMGPVVSARRKDRVLSAIETALTEGAKLLYDGREVAAKGGPQGHWLGPTILEEVTPDMAIAREEIAGPVMALVRAATLDEAIERIRTCDYASAASIFTSAGKAAREFRVGVPASMVGVNVGVVTPMAFFPYGGARQSFFGDL
jgi:malonate-semialdehyde dehydrogenase (acetylating)/methylmalonate-semialdehyde dehydrogenase